MRLDTGGKQEIESLACIALLPIEDGDPIDVLVLA
jgi:hypothetical protein